MSAPALRRLELRHEDDGGAGAPLARIEAADSFRARLVGLIGRRGLPPDGGLWLPGANGIHMLAMRFAIDAVFLGRPDERGRRAVLAVRPRLRPWIGVVWYVHRADGVIELPAGAVERLGLARGDRLRLSEVGIAR